MSDYERAIQASLITQENERVYFEALEQSAIAAGLQESTEFVPESKCREKKVNGFEAKKAFVEYYTLFHLQEHPNDTFTLSQQIASAFGKIAEEDCAEECDPVTMYRILTDILVSTQKCASICNPSAWIGAYVDADMIDQKSHVPITASSFSRPASIRSVPVRSEAARKAATALEERLAKSRRVSGALKARSAALKKFEHL